MFDTRRPQNPRDPHGNLVFAAMDDPTWDECAVQVMYAASDGSCYCGFPGGNPPAPVPAVDCPKR